jgi:uncharacterized protein
MGKLLTWLAIGLAVWAAWRLWTISRRRADAARERAASVRGSEAGDGAARDRPAAPELMMRCAVCGIHLPGSEARFAGGRVFCSDAHRDAGLAREADGTSRREDA